LPIGFRNLNLNELETKLMALLDSILGAVSGKINQEGGAGALVGVLGSLLEQNGGLQGLANRFSHSGASNVFSSWVGMGENQTISANQVEQVLGCDQVKALASKMGIDPAQASDMLAQYLPKVVDKLTPQGQIDPNANHQADLASLIPALLQNFAKRGGGAAA
jgi:uncharacterized protein YidB (DUF937 family)